MAQPVRVWRIPLTVHDPTLQRRWSLLSDEERQRTAQFKAEADRRRYIMSHGALREILAQETDCAPEELMFSTSAYGKPFLPSPLQHLQFNLSHSAQLALLAVSHDGDVGIDVEWRRPLDDLAGLIEQVCSPLEKALIVGATDAEALFYRCWVAKEAVLKCIGRGMSLPPNELEVLHAQGGVTSSLALSQGRQVQSMSLRLIDALPVECVGAIALTQDLQSSVCPRIEIQDWTG